MSMRSAYCCFCWKLCSITLNRRVGGEGDEDRGRERGKGGEEGKGEEEDKGRGKGERRREGKGWGKKGEGRKGGGISNTHHCITMHISQKIQHNKHQAG